MTQPTLYQPRGLTGPGGWRERLQSYRMVFTIALATGLSWAGIFFIAARPLLQEVAALDGRLKSLTSRMDQLVAVKGTAAAARDLLQVLADQEQTLAASRESLAALRQLRVDLEQEARLTEVAEDELARLGRMQEQVIRSGARANALQGAIDAVITMQSEIASLHSHSVATLQGLAQTDAALAQWDDLQLRVQRTGEAAGQLAVSLQAFDGLATRVQDVVAASEAGAADLERAQVAVAELGELKTRVVEQAEGLAAAESVNAATGELLASLAGSATVTHEAQDRAEGLLALAQGLQAASRESLEAASNHVLDLLAIHDLLADGESLQMAVAERNLRSLLETQSALSRTTPHVAAAAENLELLCEFQDELTKQLRDVPAMRHELTEISLLKDAVARVSDMMHPLTQLSSLRKLDADSVRMMAREILARRTAEAMPLACESPSDAAGLDNTDAAGTPTMERTVPQPVE